MFGNPECDETIRRMAKSLGVSPLFAVLLYNRGYKTPETADKFLNFETTDFHDPYLLADMDKAVDRILSAVESGEKIYIYGDYDVDGVTSVSMLYLYLTELGADVGVKIPKRDGEGYGVSMSAVQTIAERGATLIITVDTGITASAEVEYAKQLGVEFVITDHHECHGELPKACAVVNPHRPDCQYPFKELAGVGVIFKTLCACEIRRALRASERPIDGVRRICAKYADLVAVGTIADVMPLVDENRLIVCLGLSMLERGEGRPGLTALLEASSKKADDEKRKKVTSGMIGFGIAPRINAAGRMSDALIAVTLLLASKPEEVEMYAEELCDINKERQSVENDIATEAYRMIEEGDYIGKDKVIILDCDNWHPGIIGIVASRVTEKYGLPSILISYSGSIINEPHNMDDGKGSGRSIKGLNLVEALNYCEDMLVKYGGHELAAGLTVKRGTVDDFRKRINEYAEQHMTDEMMQISLEADCELQASDVTLSFADEILRLEPFGVGNASPKFILRDATLKRITNVSAGKHTKLQLCKDGVVLTAMYFGVNAAEMNVYEGDLVDIIFNLDINDYRGVRSVQLIIQDIKLCRAIDGRIESDKIRYAQICAGEMYRADEEILPDRDDFARVYTVLRREYRAGNNMLATERILGLVSDSQKRIHYAKLKIILRVLDELRICRIEELGEDIYRFDVPFNASKTSIDKSFILRKLRGQCIRVHE